MRVQRNKANDKVLDFLLWRPGEQFYEREISEKAKVSKSAVNLIMRELVDDGWVLMEEKGRLNLYQANLENAKVRVYKKGLTINKLEGLIGYLRGKVDKLVLFGSASRGEDSASSDLDIMIVSENQLEDKQVRKYLPEGREGQILIKRPDEFREMRFKNKVLYQAVMKGEDLL